MSDQTPLVAIEEKVADSELSQAQVELIHQKILKQKSHSSGSGWFYWIAGLSLITSLVSLSGGSWSFLAGLGITQIFDGFAIGLTNSGAENWVKGLSFFLDLFAAGVFVLIGLFAKKGAKPAYIIGIVLYSIDSVILLVFKEWFGVAFHAYALFQIWAGLSALRWLDNVNLTTPIIQSNIVESTVVKPG